MPLKKIDKDNENWGNDLPTPPAILRNQEKTIQWNPTYPRYTMDDLVLDSTTTSLLF